MISSTLVIDLLTTIEETLDFLGGSDGKASAYNTGNPGSIPRSGGSPGRGIGNRLQFSSVTQSCPTLCDPMNRSTIGLPVHHQLPEFTQTHALPGKSNIGRILVGYSPWGCKESGTTERYNFHPLSETSDQSRSVSQSCPTLGDPMNRSTPGLPVHHQHPEFTQTHIHRVSDAIQPSHPLSSPSPPAPNPSQHQSLFQ